MESLQSLAIREHAKFEFTQQLAVTLAAPYVSGNVLGPLITIDNSAAGPGPISEAPLAAVLRSIVVADADNQKAGINLHFFNAPPSAVVDKTAWAPSVADLQKLIGVVPIVTGDYTTIAGTALAYANGANQKGLNLILKPGVAKSSAIYCVAQVLGTPTYTSGKGIQIKFQFGNGL